MLESIEDITFNRILLSSKFDEGDRGYFVVNEVRGRGGMKAEVQSTKIPNSPGSYFRGKEYPERVVEVDFTLKGTSFTDLRRKIEELNRVLHSTSGEVPFSFSDEPGRVYYGAVDDVEENMEKSAIHKGTITIICSDPFKYGDDVHIEKTETGEVSIESEFESPFLIESEIKEDAEYAEFKRNDDVLRLNYDFDKKDKIKIDTEKEVVFINGEEKNVTIDLLKADFFKILPGKNDLQLHPKMQIKITYKERWM